MNDSPKPPQTWRRSDDNELYEELLNRYERVLIFAGQLREQVRHQQLLEESNRSLEKEVDRLNKLIGVEQSYVRLLEKTLNSLGILKDRD